MKLAVTLAVVGSVFCGVGADLEVATLMIPGIVLLGIGMFGAFYNLVD